MFQSFKILIINYNWQICNHTFATMEEHLDNNSDLELEDEDFKDKELEFDIVYPKEIFSETSEFSRIPCNSLNYEEFQKYDKFIKKVTGVSLKRFAESSLREGEVPDRYCEVFVIKDERYDCNPVNISWYSRMAVGEDCERDGHGRPTKSGNFYLHNSSGWEIKCKVSNSFSKVLHIVGTKAIDVTGQVFTIQPSYYDQHKFYYEIN